MKILEVEYGSKAYGTDNKFSDSDRIRIVAEASEYITGTGELKTKMTSKDTRSTKDDTDITIYPLKVWAKLCLNSNPTTLLPLFVNEQDVYFQNKHGRLLRDNKHLFVSKQAGEKFRGYAKSQLLALEGKVNKRTNRPELIEQHGYDTKYAYHVMRLLYSGIELMESGNITLPFTGYQKGFLLDIRNGRVSREEFLQDVEHLFLDLDAAQRNSKLPEAPDVDGINEMLHRIYLEVWGDAL